MIPPRMSMFLFVAIVGLSFFALAPASKPTSQYYTININRIGPSPLQEIKSHSAIEWWVEAGDKLLVYANSEVVDAFAAQLIDIDAIPDRLFVVHQAHEHFYDFRMGALLVQGGRQAVFQSPTAFDKLPSFDFHHPAAVAPKIRKFKRNQVISQQSSNATSMPIQFSETTHNLVSKVDIDEWTDHVDYLSSLNRFAHGSEIRTAGSWIEKQFQDMGYQVEQAPFTLLGRTQAANVIATRIGSESPSDWYIVGGHYDSTSQNPRSAAPGAEDNATGVAGVLELARIFAQANPKTSIAFIAFDGEEDGLFGSKAHVAGLSEQERKNVKGVINMDMIGYAKNSEQLAVLLETEVLAKPLAEKLRAAAEEFTALEIYTTFNAWGSDHVPYLNAGIPAVLTIDNDWDKYPAYHKTTDLIGNVVPAMAAEILKMNAATIAELAY